jgi:ABC-type glycerol-3-phosphate transport system permease component
VGEDTVQWPNLSAAAILMLIPVVTGAIFVQRFFGRLAVGARLG